LAPGIFLKIRPPCLDPPPPPGLFKRPKQFSFTFYFTLFATPNFPLRRNKGLLLIFLSGPPFNDTAQSLLLQPTPFSWDTLYLSPFPVDLGTNCHFFFRYRPPSLPRHQKFSSPPTPFFSCSPLPTQVFRKRKVFPLPLSCPFSISEDFSCWKGCFFFLFVLFFECHFGGPILDLPFFSFELWPLLPHAAPGSPPSFRFPPDVCCRTVVLGVPKFFFLVPSPQLLLGQWRRPFSSLTLFSPPLPRCPFPRKFRFFLKKRKFLFSSARFRFQSRRFFLRFLFFFLPPRFWSPRFCRIAVFFEVFSVYKVQPRCCLFSLPRDSFQ